MLERDCRYIVGRGDDADCRIDDESVSRHHLGIDTTRRPWQITDLGSKNGSRLQGRPLDCADLARSCWLTIAGIPARIELLDRASASAWQREIDTRRITARRLGRELEPGQDQSVLFDSVLDAFARLSECTEVALYLTDEQGRPERIRTRGNEDFSASSSVIEQVLRTARPVVASDVSAQQALAERQSIVTGSTRAMACLPLPLAGRIRGVLYASSQQPGKTFTALDLELLEGLARQAAFIVAVTRMRRDVERLRLQLPDSPDALESSHRLSALLERVMPPVKS